MRKKSIFAIIFIFILTMLLCKSTYSKTQELFGNVGYNRFTVRLKGDSLLKNALDKADAEELEKVLSSEMMTYYTFNKGHAATKQSKTEALICGIKGEYNAFYNMKLKRGSFLNQKDYEDKDYVAVIDESLAKSLFKSDDVIGLDIYIHGKKFKIIGITQNDTSIIGKIIEKKLPYAYIPLSIMEEEKQDYYITNIEFEAVEDSLDKPIIKDKIYLIGKNPNDFYIEDWREKGILSKQRVDILFFIIGIYWIYTLLLIVLNIFRNSLSLLKSYFRDDYFSNMMKEIGLKLWIAFSKMVGILIVLIFIWKKISFDLYILPGGFPDDPTSINEILQTMKAGVVQFIKADYSYMLHHNLMIGFLQKQVTLIFLLSLLSELYILFYILKNIKVHFNNDMEAVKSIGFYLIVSIILSFLVLYIIGFPIELSIKNIIILWAGFFTIAMVKGNKYIQSQGMEVKDE